MKRHLVARGNTAAACGYQDPQQWATDPREVTCVRCRGTLAMADAEIKHFDRKKKIRSRKGRRGSTR
jgi:hypothetical protein